MLQDICKKQGIDLYDDEEEDGEDDTRDNDGQTAATIIDEDGDTDPSGTETAEIESFRSARRRKPQKRHGGLLTFLAAMSGLAGSRSKTGPRFQVGDHVRVRYRGQEGTIIDINGGLYMASLKNGNNVDSFEEDDLEKAR